MVTLDALLLFTEYRQAVMRQVAERERERERERAGRTQHGADMTKRSDTATLVT